MSLHYLNGILTEKETIQAINKNAFNKGIKQMRQPEFKTPYTMNSYDVNDCLFYPVPTPKKQVVVNGWFEDAITNISQTTQTALTNVQQTLSTGVQNVLTTGQQALNTIQSQGQALLTNITTTVQQGLQNIQLPTINLQKLNDIWNKVQANVGKYGKKIALAPLRQAFISAVSYNAYNLGKYMLEGWNKDKTKITNLWVNDWAGDINVLKQAIAKGSKTAISGNSIGVDAEAILKIVGIALPIIAAVIGILKSIGVNTKKEDTDALSRTAPVEPPPTTATSTQFEIVPSDTLESSTNKTLMYVGIGGAVLLGGYLLMKKSK
jgi:hypothetical protein